VLLVARACMSFLPSFLPSSIQNSSFASLTHSLNPSLGAIPPQDKKKQKSKTNGLENYLLPLLLLLNFPPAMRCSDCLPSLLRSSCHLIHTTRLSTLFLPSFFSLSFSRVLFVVSSGQNCSQSTPSRPSVIPALGLGAVG
jgi:hypothetical protein